MTASETSLRSLIGIDLGPYRLTRRLGVGGMAEAYEAIRRGPGGFTQRVCLKLVLPFFAEDDSFIELFEREARLAATLRHSNIVGVIDFGAIDGRRYMALELVDGPDLRVLLDQQTGKRLAAGHVALLGLELARALEHAHQARAASSSEGTEEASHGIVHRDVSPSNILISVHGEIMLTDFGVAKAMSGTSRKQSAVKGKIPYMSPEQLRADALDGRADLFALGVVLFEALAGERPYEGAHDPATIMLILEGNHPRLSTLAPNAPAGLCEVIDRLIEPSPERRPKSAAALIELLDEFAPSPRMRRQLSALAAECKRRVEEAASQISSIQGTEATRSQSQPFPLVEDTGIKRTASAKHPDVTGPGPKSGAAARLPAAIGEDATNPPPSSPPQAVASRPWTRRDLAKLMAGFVLAVGGIAGAGIALRQTAQREEPPPAPAPRRGESQAAPPAPSSSESVSAEIEPEVPNHSSAPAAAKVPVAADPSIDPVARAERAIPEPRPAHLSVVVFPWGKVWINGNLRGPAPLQSQVLPPGRYKVSVGRDAPTKSQVIRLRAGQSETIRFDLTQ